jgi:hypothetical protein
LAHKKTAHLVTDLAGDIAVNSNGYVIVADAGLRMPALQASNLGVRVECTADWAARVTVSAISMASRNFTVSGVPGPPFGSDRDL